MSNALLDRDWNPVAVGLHPERLDKPLKWRKPSRVSVCTISDLFCEDIPDQFIRLVLSKIMLAYEHTFLISTKHPDRMKELIVDYFSWWSPAGDEEGVTLPKNLWLGVSVENQEMAKKRIPILLQIPAIIRYVSLELKELVDLFPWLPDEDGYIEQPPHDDPSECPIWYDWCHCALSWVTCSGEKGHQAIPMLPDWVRSLRQQCNKAQVPFCFKSWGEYCDLYQMPLDTYRKWTLGGSEKWPKRFVNHLTVWKVGMKSSGRLLDGQIWDEIPGDSEKK